MCWGALGVGEMKGHDTNGSGWLRSVHGHGCCEEGTEFGDSNIDTVVSR
jgi:hypothetical protein